MKHFRLIFFPVISLCLFLFAFQEPAQSTELEARFAGQQTVDGQNALAVTFSLPLDSTQDLSKYFSIIAHSLILRSEKPSYAVLQIIISDFQRAKREIYPFIRSFFRNLLILLIVKKI